MICSIVVLYNPITPPEALCRALATYSKVILVDNSTDSVSLTFLSEWVGKTGFYNIDMKGNAGIAAAQNAGLRLAKALGALGVIFFDQDSQVDATALAALTDAILGGEYCVYALSPGEHVLSTGSTPVRVLIRELMSSGSGCRMSIFGAVGEFEAGLFIDMVDFEWGWRCRQHGIKLVGLRAGTFLHTLGRSEVRFFGMCVHIDSPTRLYYQFRNIVVMMRRNYVPLAWKISQALRSLGKLVIVVALSPPRLHRLVLIGRGVRDGLFNRLGPSIRD
jgi:rhamnosyltransferase